MGSAGCQPASPPTERRLRLRGVAKEMPMPRTPALGRTLVLHLGVSVRAPVTECGVIVHKPMCSNQHPRNKIGSQSSRHRQIR